MVFDRPTPPPCLSSTLSPLHHHPPSSSETTQNESERCTNVHYLSCASSPGYPQYVLSDRAEEEWHLVDETLAVPNVCLSVNGVRKQKMDELSLFVLETQGTSRPHKNSHPISGPVDKYAGFEIFGATSFPTSSVLDLKSTVNHPAKPLIGPADP